MKIKKLDLEQLFNVIFVLITMVEKISMIDIWRYCSGKPGYVYNFNVQNLLTFEENLKFKQDIPLTAYIDFETTAPTDDCLDPQTRKMKAVSYVIIFAFHPDLKLN